MFRSLFLSALVATTSEASAPYEIVASSSKPAGLSVIIDEHQRPQSRPHPYLHPDSPAALNNISFGAVQDGPPLPPTDVKASRQPDGNVLIQWTPSLDHVDHYALQYRTVGGWLPLTDHLDADTTSHEWTTASHGVVYDFRLLSVSRQWGNSLPSNVATLGVDGLNLLALSRLHRCIHCILMGSDFSRICVFSL